MQDEVESVLERLVNNEENDQPWNDKFVMQNKPQWTNYKDDEDNENYEKPLNDIRVKDAQGEFYNQNGITLVLPQKGICDSSFKIQQQFNRAYFLLNLVFFYSILC